LVRQSLGYVRPFGLGTLEPLLSLGIEAAQHSQARWEFKKEVDPIIQSMGLTVPDPVQGRKFL
jgi:hypothetical protein